MFQRSRFLKICASGDKKAFEKALRNIPDVNFYKSGTGSPLTEVCRKGHFDLVKRLIEHGADVTKSSEHCSPITTTSWCGHNDILEYLIEKGANLNFRTHNEQTALMNSVAYGYYDCTKTLINAGANLNLQDKHGNTALITSINCYRSEYEIIKLLIKSGADQSIKNKEGYTAADYARKKGKFKILELFEKSTEISAGYNFTGPQKVTEALEVCPINGQLSEIFNFESQTVTQVSKTTIGTPMRFDDYVMTLKDGQERIERAYQWLNTQPKGAPTYPFKRVVDIRKQK